MIPCLLLWPQLYTLGLISDRRANAIRLEFARLCVVMPIGVLAIALTRPAAIEQSILWLAVVGYGASCEDRPAAAGQVRQGLRQD